MATYEPFGISPLEPLGAGTICVISSVCGCKGFVDEITANKPVDNVLVADYTRLDSQRTINELLAMTQADRDVIERRVARSVADELMRRLPQNDDQRRDLLDAGQRLVSLMGWDQVLAAKPLPMLRRVFSDERSTVRRETASTTPAAPV
jgi:glycogen synthase